ncbi:hypothetical protein Baya_9901 [Bagarius yarrelli]|uniref:Uncharacterized protein n=1 Tax=Bagarius yarrelli TaxID=175774 RepID=A0A556U8Y7_BAGYA|nr:hypothetical protein Baya_9901 [Bagarius yarrelli]
MAPGNEAAVFDMSSGCWEIKTEEHDLEGVTRLNFSSGSCQGVPPGCDGQGLDSKSHPDHSSHTIPTTSVYRLSD